MLDYKVVFSDRKSAEIQIKLSGEVIVRMPRRATKRDAERFVAENLDKILKSLEKMEEKRRQLPPPPNEDEIRDCIERAKAYLPARTEYFAELMGVRPTGIRISSAKKRFGSCSPKNSISYSWQVMLYPDELVDYVIVHELAHIKHKNHGKDFYAFIASVMPDHKERRRLLSLPPKK